MSGFRRIENFRLSLRSNHFQQENIKKENPFKQTLKEKREAHRFCQVWKIQVSRTRDGGMSDDVTLEL